MIWAFCAGIVFTLVCISLYGKWYTKRANADVDSMLQKRIESMMGSDSAKQKMKDVMLEHKDRIEFDAVRRLAAAMDQAERTGKVVKIELAGIEEYIYVSPPPGTGNNSDPN